MLRKFSMVQAYSIALVFFGTFLTGRAGALASCMAQAGLVPPTKVASTHIRKGFGEYGAPREHGTHAGIDIVLRLSSTDPTDYEVHAVSPGIVAYAQQNGSADSGYGNVVVVDHGNGCYTMYAHLSNKPFTPQNPGGNLNVKVGDQIGAGDLIGYMRELKADVDGSGNALKLAPPFRTQLHFALIHAEAGRRGPGLLSTSILKQPAEVLDPTQLLSGLGYRVE